MEAASNFFSSNFMTSGVLSGKSLMDFTPLNKSQKRHMRRVYSMLTLGILSTALGALFDIYVFRVPHFVAIIATIGFIFATVSSSTTNDSLKRSGYFLGFAFSKGILIASLLEIAHRIHPAIISTAFFISLAIFAAFALTAMFATERSFLFLGGVLSSVVFYMGLAGLANIFFQSQIIFDIQLYGGLLVFLGYVLFDTQVALEESKSGNADYVRRALDFYIDLSAIFVRILIILIKQQQKKEDERDRDRKRR